MALVPTARQLFAVRGSDRSGGTGDPFGLDDLSRFAHQAARRLNRVETDDFRFLRAVILEAAKHPAPEPQPGAMPASDARHGRPPLAMRPHRRYLGSHISVLTRKS